MYRALNYWVFGGFGPNKTPYEFIDFAKEQGLDGVELTVGDCLPVDIGEEECRMIAAYAKERGVGLRTLATGCYGAMSLGAADEAERQKALDFTRKYLQIAAWIGAETVLVIPGSAHVTWDPSRPVVPYGTVWEKSTKSLGELVPEAERLGVNIALENVWMRFLLSPMEWKLFLDQFASDRIGMYLDVGNCLIYAPAQDYVETLGVSRIKAVHIKNWRGDDCGGTLHGFGDSLLAGDVDFEAVFAALKAGGYDRTFTVEMIPFSRLPDLVLPDHALAEKSVREFKTLKGLACALFAALALPFAAFSAEKVPQTAEEILAQPRRATVKTPMPKDGSGVYIGSGVYPCTGCLMGTGLCFTYWQPKHPTLDETIELCAKEQVGNTLQFWPGGNLGVGLAKKARAKGITSVFLYGVPGDKKADTQKFVAEMGDDYLGYDFGERFSFNVNDSSEVAAGGKAGETTLQTLADDYVRRVNEHVNYLHKKGVGNVQATSGNFGLDYEVAAGAEIPCTEDFPFGDLNYASALSRGLYRQYDLPMWGSHLAHEWYSWIPHTCPYKMRSLETAFQLKYMAGSKMIINESGNWQLQSGLCPDSPMSKMPILRGNPVGMYPPSDPRSGFNAEVMKEAERKFAFIDVRSPVATKYRRIISDFYAFCKKNPCPKGQPEATVALAKGNLDLGEQRYIAGYAICNAYGIADADSRWYHGHPEQSWEVLTSQVLPRPAIFAPDYNLHFSATPFGQVDIASFALDNMTAEHLLKNYKVLIFSGWNTCSPKQYKVLCDYVNGGGILVLGVCHLSTNKTRNFTSFTKEELVNGGDFTELCNLKVVKKDHRFFWATGPEPTPNKIGFVARRRWGYMGVPLAKIEYTGKPSDYEKLAVDDETEDPVVVEVKKGKGRVILLTAWAYPAAVNQDWGCGARVEQRGMMGEIYRYAAKLGRGNVWITGPDFENPDAECDFVAFSYFPDAGKICLLNLDYEKPHKFVMHWFGDKDFITLAPGEFRLMDAPVLEKHEKLNAE